MWIILFVPFCALCIFVFPPPLAFAALMLGAVSRLLYLTRNEAIDAVAEVARMPGELVSDIRRNGMAVLRLISWWVFWICLWLCSLYLFDIRW